VNGIEYKAGVCRGRLASLIGLVLLSFLTLVSGARAQNPLDSLLQRGSPSFTSADVLPGGLGFVNVANGNLHLEIPLGNYPQRGGSSQPFIAKLIYDTREWEVESNGTSSSWGIPYILGGWSIITSQDAGFFNYGFGEFFCTGGHTNTYDIFDWRAPDHTDHVFPITVQADHGCGNTNVLTGDAFALDESGLHMFVTVTPSSGVTDTLTVTVYTKGGTAITPSDWGGNFQANGRVEDSNGNFWQGNTYVGTPPFDTLGRQPLTISFPPNPHYYTPPTSYNILNSQNARISLPVTWALIHVHTNFQVPQVTEGDFYINVVRSLTLPDGSSYKFTYDCDSGTGNSACSSPSGLARYYGLPTSVTLPTGGTISITYANFKDANGNVNRWVSGRNSGGGTWTYAPATGCGASCQTVTVTRPSGDHEVYSFTLSQGNGAWNTGVSYYTGAASGSPLMTVQTTYQSFPTDATLGSFAYTHPASTAVTLPAPSGNLVKQTTYTYDTLTYTFKGVNHTGSIGKLLTESEYALGNGGAGGLVRTTVISYLDNANSAYKSKNIVNRPTDIQVKDSGGSVRAETKITYDSTTPTSVAGTANHDDTDYGTGNNIRGNPTVIQRLVSGTTYLSTNLSYDTTGQVRSIQDSAGNTTSFSYSDNLFNDAYGGPPAYTLPKPTNAYVTTMTLPLIGSATFGNYWGSGKQAYSQDQNGARTWTHFLDPSSMDRITHVYTPDGGRKLWRYNGATQIDTFLSIQNTNGTFDCTSCRFDRLALDTWGRVSTNTLENGPEGYESVVTYYDSNSRVQQVSNPYRSPSDPTYGLDTYSYDGLDRVTQVTHQDGNSAHIYYGAAVSGAGGAASQQCYQPTFGTGFPTLYVDEAGKKRQTWTDGFGRIVELQEPDTSGTLNDNTCYQYDVQNNLIQAHSGLNRSYTYDSLSRLTSATTPETGARTTYFYYTTASGPLCSGNPAAVCRRTDARSITTTYTYDALNRLTSKTYSDGTPTVKFFYDQPNPWQVPITNYLGRLTETVAYASDGSYLASAMFSYDAMGRIVLNQQCTLCSGPNPSFLMRYAYNLDGSLASLTYPSGRVVSYNVGNAQRPLSATDSNGTQYAVAASYTPFGAVSSVIYGKVSSGFAGITETRGYDNRLQLGGIVASSSAGAALNIGASYNLPGGNNGSISSIANSSDTGRTQTFTYDTLNRIASATSQATSGADCWGQSFTDDPQANLYTIGSTQCSSGTLSVSINAYNQIIGTNFGYDLAGNMTGDGTGYTYTFDAENRLTKANGMSGGPWNYTYDADGLRVEKTNGSTGTLYWRSIFGDTLAESDLAASKTNGNYHEYVYFTGRKIARVDGSGGVFFYYADHVGTTRTITDSSGHMCYDADFTPYGQEMVHTNNCPQNYKFTGYERDPETGLDYAFARYYSSRLGRFLSADPWGGNRRDPQSLNRYSYVLNSPVSLTDPSGLDPDFWAVLGYWSPLLYGDLSGGFGAFGSFAGGGFAGGPATPIQLLWTPNGYLVPGLMPPPPTQPPAFSPPSFNYDVQVGMDIWHDSPSCPGCGCVWQHAAGAMNTISLGYTALYVGAFAGATYGPALAARGIGWAYGLGGGSGVVLGNYDQLNNYLGAAESVGANAFNVAKPLWNALNNVGEAWTANQAFLDASIARGQSFYLATQPLGAAGSFEMELEYLTSRGIGPWSWSMVPLPF
jgi:RHS repeat-associated protein